MLVQGLEPAFPCLDKNGDGYIGMTLRDFFASQTLNGLYQILGDAPESIARISYQIADAMIKERKLK